MLILGFLSPPAAAMSHLEQLIISMVDVFEEYAGQEGKKNQISMDELKTLIDNEVSQPEFQVGGNTHNSSRHSHTTAHTLTIIT